MCVEYIVIIRKRFVIGSKHIGAASIGIVTVCALNGKYIYLCFSFVALLIVQSPCGRTLLL